MSNTYNYGFNLTDDSDPMPDVDYSLNSNWALIENAPRPVGVSSLPITDFSYNLGDRIFHTTLVSMFVLVAQNATWGNFWKPIQTKFGPWIQPGNSILSLPATYKFGTTPVQYRLTNTGKFIMRGSVDTVAGTGYNDFESLSAPANLMNIPDSMAPSQRSVYAAAPYPQTTASAKPVVSQIVVHTDGSFGNLVWNPNNNATGLFYDGIEWVVGYGRGYGPDN